MIPISFGLLTLSALARILKQILVIAGKKVAP
jgi:TRAP-type mannitol/chloroaromatic compound transport system permease small subunit